MNIVTTIGDLERDGDDLFLLFNHLNIVGLPRLPWNPEQAEILYYFWPSPDGNWIILTTTP